MKLLAALLSLLLCTAGLSRELAGVSFSLTLPEQWNEKPALKEAGGRLYVFERGKTALFSVLVLPGSLDEKQALDTFVSKWLPTVKAPQTTSSGPDTGAPPTVTVRGRIEGVESVAIFDTARNAGTIAVIMRICAKDDTATARDLDVMRKTLVLKDAPFTDAKP